MRFRLMRKWTTKGRLELWAEGKTLRSAVIWAMAAGAIAVTKRGAQTAMPTREEIAMLLKEQPRK